MKAVMPSIAPLLLNTIKKISIEVKMLRYARHDIRWLLIPAYPHTLIP